ncbi:MAG: methyltransferase domain-containing protein [Campylobacterota bacterium]|nr:methyltransferase domain-containing protein [Campylobacterota bacterium]
MKNFTIQTMFEIINILEKEIKSLKPKGVLEFEVLNPDIVTSQYAGTVLTVENEKYIYRGYKAWLDLAQLLYCKMLTPLVSTPQTIIIRFEKLNEDVSFHKSDIDKEEKYGVESIFSQIHKNEEPSFLHYYKQALQNVNINKRVRILNLGVNSGDEFELIQQYASNFKNLELVGIDYCPSAILEAKSKFIESKNITFYTHDVNDLESLNLGRFDLIISIGTLQSTNLEFNPLFMSIVQNQLKTDGAMILGFPNCRWIDGEMIYGARVKHYPFPESSLLYKDTIFCKKYLQQKKFRVTLTGKEYIFLTATSIRKENV